MTAPCGTDPSLMIGGCQDNGTIKYDGSSTVWTQIRGGDGATVAFDPTNAEILYAMYQNAESIARSTNGGGGFDPFAAGLPTGVCENLQFLVHPTSPRTACLLHLAVADHVTEWKLDSDLYSNRGQHRPARLSIRPRRPVLRRIEQRQAPRRPKRWFLATSFRPPHRERGHRSTRRPRRKRRALCNLRRHRHGTGLAPGATRSRAGRPLGG